MESPSKQFSGIFRVVLIYAFFAGLWILLSDRAMGLLFSEPDALVRASMAKGWFFVAVTSLLLFVLVKGLVAQLTEAHRIEQEHRRAQERPPPMLVAIAESSEDAIFAKDAEGRYLLFNNAAARYVGRPAEAVLGQDDRALFPAEQADHVMAIDRRVRESGQAETNEETLMTAAGERVFLATKGPLRGPDGKVFGTFGISRDITARIRGEETARRLADDMNATLQAIPDLLFEIDAAGRYLKVRAANESQLAAAPNVLLGRTVDEVLPADAARIVMDAIAAASQKGTDYGRTIVLPLAAGQRHFELSVARKMRAEGEAEHFVILSRDITARHEAESELRQRNAELERFNRAATERELRMIELKREINALARELGRDPPHDLSFVGNDARQDAP